MGIITLAFASLFAITLVTVHIIERETNLSPISLYSLGPFGIVMRAGFVILGLAFLSIVVGLRGRARPTTLHRVDLLMLSIAGAGLVTIGAFNTDALGDRSDSLGSHSQFGRKHLVNLRPGRNIIVRCSFSARREKSSHRTIVKEFGNCCNGNLSWRFS